MTAPRAVDDERMFCIVCGQDTGSNTDLCVTCALRGLRRSG